MKIEVETLGQHFAKPEVGCVLADGEGDSEEWVMEVDVLVVLQPQFSCMMEDAGAHFILAEEMEMDVEIGVVGDGDGSTNGVFTMTVCNFKD